MPEVSYVGAVCADEVQGVVLACGLVNNLAGPVPDHGLYP